MIKTIIINEYGNTDGSYTIVLKNARLYQRKIFEIIKCFAKGNELFLGHYKVDGVYLSKNELSYYRKEITSFFETNGRFLEIPAKQNKKFFSKKRESDLTVCSMPNTDDMYKIFYKVFDYYLETIFFCPNINWDVFVQSFDSYLKHAAKIYVLNGYTDFLFAYSDSGIFSVTFNPNKYKSTAVREIIENIIRG